MTNLIIEFGIMAAFSISNTPWNKKDFQTPYLLVEKSAYEDFYFRSFNSSRTQAVRLNQMNPQTALWDVSFGYKAEIDGGILDISIGHQSEHEVGKLDKLTESFDYAKISYRLEYK